MDYKKRAESINHSSGLVVYQIDNENLNNLNSQFLHYTLRWLLEHNKNVLVDFQKECMVDTSIIASFLYISEKRRKSEHEFGIIHASKNLIANLDINRAKKLVRIFDDLPSAKKSLYISRQPKYSIIINDMSNDIKVMIPEKIGLEVVNQICESLYFYKNGRDKLIKRHINDYNRKIEFSKGIKIDSFIYKRLKKVLKLKYPENNKVKCIDVKQGGLEEKIEYYDSEVMPPIA